MEEQTLAMIKPDAFEKGAVGRVISRIERKMFHIRKMKLGRFSYETAGVFYAEHRGRAFFHDLCTFMSGGPVIAMVLESQYAGDPIILDWRNLMGATNSAEALPGTIRHEMGSHEVIMRNVVHGSDSKEAAEREIALVFGLI